MVRNQRIQQVVLPQDIKTAVPIQQSQVSLLGNYGTESKIAIAFFGSLRNNLGRQSHLQAAQR